MKKLIIYVFPLFSSLMSFGQQTGSFDVSVSFNGQPRTLSFFVPVNYDPSIKYRLLVALHGAGDNSGNYRNALMNILNWNVHMPNTIFVCPDGGNDASRTHYIPTGDEQIIQEGIKYAKQNFSIDTTNIVLQGFSVGGRSALRFGLDHYSQFKGLLLNTPAMQGVKDVYTYYLAGGGFVYSNSSHIPIYLTVGTNDGFYYAPVDSLYEQLIFNDGMVRYYPVAGMAHNIPPFTLNPDPWLFFDHPHSVSADLDVYKIKMPPRGCISNLAAGCIVRNIGSDTLNSIDIKYTWGGVTQTYAWTGSLKPFEHSIISLPPLTAVPGSQTLGVDVGLLNTALQDTIVSNNIETRSYEYVTNGAVSPTTEGFEGSTFPPAGWVQVKAGDYIFPWSVSSDLYTTPVSKTGNGSMVCFNTVMAPNNSGRREQMFSPLINLSTFTTPFLNFDVAYNYHKYSGTTYADSLEIYISVDCGASYQLIFKKGGTQLATFSQPINSPSSVADMLINPAPENWRPEAINLGNFSTATEAVFNFCYKSARGGSIAIDNISFGNTALEVAELNKNSIMLYPNPANDHFTIAWDRAFRVSEIIILNHLGRLFWSGTVAPGEVRKNVETKSFAPGLYIVKVSDDLGNLVLNQKIIVQ